LDVDLSACWNSLAFCDWPPVDLQDELVVKSIDNDVDYGGLSAMVLNDIAHEDRWRNRFSASYVPPTVQEVDKSYRNNLHGRYIVRPAIAKPLFRFKRFRAYWHHLMRESKRDQ
jgi:hypothetical protein